MFIPAASPLCRLRTTPSCRLIAVALLSLLAASAVSADERLKDLLGRAQQQLDGKAVEDLVGKLEGSKPSPSGSKPAEAKAPEVKPDQGIGPAIELSMPSLDQPPGRASPPTAATPPSNLAPATALPPTVPMAPALAPAKPATGGVAVTLPQPQPATNSANPEVQLSATKDSGLPSVDLEITFEFNSAEISPKALTTLALLGRALSDPRLATATFLIGGHTDAKGRADYNRHLSQLRADAVRAFLISSYAIASSRLTAKGFGESRLKNPRNPRADENRRVQITNISNPAGR